MKKIIAFSFCLLFSLMIFSQEKVLIHQNGFVTYEQFIEDVDNIHFLNSYSIFDLTDQTNNQISIYAIDSLTFGNIQNQGDTVYITYNGTNNASIINPYSSQGLSITVNGGSVTVDAQTSISNINYVVSGSSNAGILSMVSDMPFVMRLRNLSLSNTTNYCIGITNEVAAQYIITGNNSLTDASTSSGNAALYSKGTMTFSGNGTLTISGMKKHAINCTQKITINSGNYIIESSVSDGIHSEGFDMYDGSIQTSYTLGDGIDASGYAFNLYNGNINVNLGSDDANAIKSDGNISINGGSITAIVTGQGSKGINSSSDIIINSGIIDISVSGGILYETTDTSSCVAIKADGNITIIDGDLTVSATSIDSKGISGDGTVSISGGDITMTISGQAAKGIKSKTNVTINGGTLDFTCSGAVLIENYNPSYCSAIKSDNSITINGGNITVNSTTTATGSKGLSADGEIRVNGGTINITTAGNGNKFLLSNGTTYDSYTSCCIKSNTNIYLLAGDITCYSSGTGGKCVKAEGTLTIGIIGADNDDLQITATTTGARFLVSGSSSGGFPGSESGDYANPDVIKSIGNLTVNSGTITINGTQNAGGGEGLECKAVLTINAGNITINTYDDCINGVGIVFNGGYVHISARGDDAIDSNSALTFNGGFIISNGVKGDGEAFDGESGSYAINGGTLIGTCGSIMENPGGPQKAVVFGASSGGPGGMPGGTSTSPVKAGQAINITDNAGNSLLMYNVPIIANASSGDGVVLVFSNNSLVQGSYTLHYGGTITGGTNINGYVTGGTYSGGSTKTFSITSANYTTVQ